MSWLTVVVLAAGTFVCRAIGPMLFAGRPLSARVRAALDWMPIAMLVCLVLTQTLGAGIAPDVRTVSVGCGIVVACLGAPMWLVISVAAVCAAVLRAVI